MGRFNLHMMVAITQLAFCVSVTESAQKVGLDPFDQESFAVRREKPKANRQVKVDTAVESEGVRRSSSSLLVEPTGLVKSAETQQAPKRSDVGALHQETGGRTAPSCTCTATVYEHWAEGYPKNANGGQINDAKNQGICTLSGVDAKDPTTNLCSTGARETFSTLGTHDIGVGTMLVGQAPAPATPTPTISCFNDRRTLSATWHEVSTSRPGYCSNDGCGSNNKYQYYSSLIRTNSYSATLEVCQSYCESYGSMCKGISYGDGGAGGYCRVHVSDQTAATPAKLTEHGNTDGWQAKNGGGSITGVVENARGVRCYAYTPTASLLEVQVSTGVTTTSTLGESTQGNWIQQSPEGYCSNDGGSNRYQYWSTPALNTADVCKAACESYGSKCKGISYGGGYCRVHVSDPTGLTAPSGNSDGFQTKGGGGLINGVAASGGKVCYTFTPGAPTTAAPTAAPTAAAPSAPIGVTSIKLTGEPSCQCHVYAYRQLGCTGEPMGIAATPETLVSSTTFRSYEPGVISPDFNLEATLGWSNDQTRCIKITAGAAPTSAPTEPPTPTPTEPPSPTASPTDYLNMTRACSMYDCGWWCLDGCHDPHGPSFKNYPNSRAASTLQSPTKACTPAVAHIVETLLCQTPEPWACTYLSLHPDGAKAAKIETAIKKSPEYTKAKKSGCK